MVTTADGEQGGRRRFLALMGLAGISSALGVRVTNAQTPTPKTPAGATPAAPAAPAPPEISDDARALAGILKRRYGEHLSDADLKDVTEEIQFRLGSGKTLRAAKLSNGDEPDFTFRA